MFSKTKNLIIAIILIITGQSFAQQVQGEYEHSHLNMVIARSGLHMRAMPDENAKSLALIPFGTQLEIEEEVHYGYNPAIEVANTYFYMNKNYYTGELDSVFYDIPLDGFWLKAKYEDIEGYVFSAYLYETMKDAPENGVTMLFEGANMSYYYNPEWYWYALYDDGEQQLLEEITIDFFTLISDATGDAELHVKTNFPKREAVMIVGSDTPMPYREIDGTILTGSNNIYNYMERTIDKEVLEQTNLSLTANLDAEGYHVFSTLTVKGGDGNTQVVNAFDACSFCAPLLLWYGDLDGDGKMDYLLSDVTHYGGPIKLFLSSLADKDKLLKEVAAWFPPAGC